MSIFYIHIHSEDWNKLKNSTKFLSELSKTLKEHQGESSVEIFIIDENKKIPLNIKVSINLNLQDSVKRLKEKYLNLINNKGWNKSNTEWVGPRRKNCVDNNRSSYQKNKREYHNNSVGSPLFKGEHIKVVGVNNDDLETQFVEGKQAESIKVDADKIDKKNKGKTYINRTKLQSNLGRGVTDEARKQRLRNFFDEKIKEKEIKEAEKIKEKEIKETEKIKYKKILEAEKAANKAETGYYETYKERLNREKKENFWRTIPMGIAETCGGKCGLTIRKGKEVKKQLFETEEIAKNKKWLNQEVYECEFKYGWHIRTRRL